MDWKECKEKRFVKEIKIDKSLIHSLIESSKKKIESNKRLMLDQITASTKVGIAYESIREVLESLAIKMGFKIYNHECFCSFLDEICKDRSSSIEFNRFRMIRNQINYYGKDISIEEAKSIIKEITLLRKKIINKYLGDI